MICWTPHFVCWKSSVFIFAFCAKHVGMWACGHEGCFFVFWDTNCETLTCRLSESKIFLYFKTILLELKKKSRVYLNSVSTRAHDSSCSLWHNKTCQSKTWIGWATLCQIGNTWCSVWKCQITINWSRLMSINVRGSYNETLLTKRRGNKNVIARFIFALMFCLNSAFASIANKITKKTHAMTIWRDSENYNNCSWSVKHVSRDK